MRSFTRRLSASAEAAEPRSVDKQGRKTELPLLCRVDVEALKAHVSDAEGSSVFKPVEDNKSAKARDLLPRQYLAADAVEKRQHFCMAPDIQAASELERHADKPYHAEQMVGMCVRDKEVVYLLFPQPGAFQLRKDSVAASGIDEKNASCSAVQSEARVVAPRRKRVSGAEHSYSVAAHTSHFAASLSPTIPATISAAEAMRKAEADSPNAMMPTATPPIAPMPVQTA